MTADTTTALLPSTPPAGLIEVMAEAHEASPCHDLIGSMECAYRALVDWMRAAPATPSAAQPDPASVDAIVSALYRRFKGWAARGFGPDDVTWREVRADVLALIATAAPGAQPAQPDAEERGVSEAATAQEEKPLSREPSAWWAETGTAGAGGGCNKPFWLRHEAINYVQEHGGHIAPLFVVPLALGGGQPDRAAFHAAAGEVLDKFGEIIGVAQVECIWRALSAARAAQPVGEVVEELSRLGLCWDAEYFPTLDPDEEFGIAPENHYRVTITTSLEDTATGWGATLEEAARAALRSGEGR